jgi:ubiquitin-protein ligase
MTSVVKSDKALRQYKRLENELKRIQEDQKDNKNDSGFNVWAVNDSLTEWEGEILGPSDTLYSNGKFPIKILIPEGYPCKPPIMFFTAKIYHPNISRPLQTPAGIRSDICVDILKDNWSPALSITSVLISIRNLFNDPNFKDPLNPEAVEHYLHNKSDYEKKVKEYTRINTPI